MDASHITSELTKVLYTNDQVQARLADAIGGTIDLDAAHPETPEQLYAVKPTFVLGWSSFMKDATRWRFGR